MAEQRESRVKLYTAGAAFALVIGFAFYGIKQCVPYGDTLTLIFYRYVAAALGVLVFWLVWYRRRLGNGFGQNGKRRPTGMLFLTAAFYLLFMILQILAMYYSTSIEGAIVFAMVPIFAKIIGRALLGERSTRLQLFFVTLTVAALMVLILLNATDIHVNFRGILIMLISTIFMACQNVSARYVRGVFAPFEITACISVMGLVIFGVAVLIRAGIRGEMRSLIEPLSHMGFVFWAAFLGIGCILASAQIMAYMLAHLEIVQCTIFSSASTLVSIVAGVLLLGESLSWFHYVCGALILIGVIGLSVAPAGSGGEGKAFLSEKDGK